MASYNILFKRSAEKELRKIAQPDLSRIIHSIQSLAHAPRPHGARMIKGPERHWRIRQGDYRVVYEINDAALHITIIKVGHRREVHD